MSHLLTLSIHQATPGLYRARVSQGDVEVTEPSYHQNVESAIFDRAGPAAWEGIMGFHVWYGGIYVGTFPIELIESRESELGDFLSALSQALA
ncbi:MAG: hypothetical protein JZU58_18585 [Curvibacter lanceolatus]|uniref:hypothetical protein n=1 Tax=Curvibacter lanceolatus TaxID=86182 RepID=UPI00035C14BF|nr:hypothetical protein [Curvibacter lanceolatus]MBV5294352.1 hypothetical protein [Curvibacter lanceolatus]